MLLIKPGLEIPDEELVFTYSRSGGPGGQNVNKVSSKAHLRWQPATSAVVLPLGALDRMKSTFPSRFTTEGEILIVSQEYRDQERNRQECLDKLVAMIRACLYPPRARKKTKPTWGSQIRRMEEKKRQSERKQNRRPGSGE